MFLQLPIDWLFLSTGTTGSTFTTQTTVADVCGTFLGSHLHEALALRNIERHDERSTRDTKTVHDFMDNSSKECGHDWDLEVNVTHVAGTDVWSSSTGTA
jgi:hypothetical protein